MTYKNDEHKNGRRGKKRKKSLLGEKKSRRSQRTLFSLFFQRCATMSRQIGEYSQFLPAQEKPARITRRFCINVGTFRPRCLPARTISLKAPPPRPSRALLNFNLIALKVTECTAPSFEFTVLSHIPTASRA